MTMFWAIDTGGSRQSNEDDKAALEIKAMRAGRWMLQQQKQGIKGVCMVTEKQRLTVPRSYLLV